MSQENTYVIQVTALERILVYQIPAPGPQGPSGTIVGVQVESVSAGTPPSVTNLGTPQAAILDFKLPVQAFGDIDGGEPDSVYGGITPIDGGGV